MNECKYKLTLFIILVLSAAISWASTTPVIQLLSERHRTEWNWVEYRIALKNTSNEPLENPRIRYFAANPRIQHCKANPNNVSCVGAGLKVIDSTLRVVVDNFSKNFFE